MAVWILNRRYEHKDIIEYKWKTKTTEDKNCRINERPANTSFCQKRKDFVSHSLITCAHGKQEQQKNILQFTFVYIYVRARIRFSKIYKIS